MRNLSEKEIQSLWPKLRPNNYTRASKATPRYNCLAFALKDERHWWEDGLHGKGYRWPSGIQNTLDGWVTLFTRDGYQLTTNRDVEPGCEKVAIYVSLTDPSDLHVAISDGKSWKSKLGKREDIEHESLDLLEGDEECEYGVVERILRRPFPAKRQRRARI